MIEKLLLIGCGHMGRALLKSWLRAKDHCLTEIAIIDPNLHDSYRFSSTNQINLSYHKDKNELPVAFKPDCIVFAIKPQMVDEVVPSYIVDKGKSPLYLSILAGTKIQKFCHILGATIPFIRIMPNLPVVEAQGANVAFANEFVSYEQKSFLTNLFTDAGILTWIDQEKDFDAVTALSGSGPAYVFALAEAMSKAGQEAGLSAKLATDLSIQTLYGAALMLKNSNLDAKTLRENVTSKKGTTEAGLKTLLHQNALEELITKTILAAKKRSQELSK